MFDLLDPIGLHANTEPTTLEAAVADLVSYNKTINVQYGDSSVALELINFGDALNYLRNLASKAKLVNKFTREEIKFLPLIEHCPAKALKVGDSFKALDYLDLRPVQIYKPIGLSVTFMELADFLETQKDLFLNLETLAFIPYTRYLRTVIEDPTEVTGLPRELTRLPDPDKINKALGKLFKGNEGVDVGTIGELTHRLKDFDDLAVKLDELTEEFAKVNRDGVLSALNIVVQTIDELIDIFVKHQDYKPTKAFVVSLSDQTALLAGLAASYSLYTAKLIALEKAAKDNVVRIKEVTDKMR